MERSRRLRAFRNVWLRWNESLGLGGRSFLYMLVEVEIAAGAIGRSGICDEFGDE
jgi:hypothetical protein